MKRDGFTLAELLVASVVATVALLCIHGLFFHALDVEARSAVRWTESDTAEAVVARLAVTLEATVNLSNVKTLVIDRGAERDGWLICQTPTQRVRYRWQKDEDDGKYTLTMQAKPFAGTKELTKGALPDEDAQAGENWDSIPAVTIAKGLEEVSVQARPLSKASQTRDGRYEGPAGKVAIRLKVSSGGQTARRIVIPRCDANTEESQEGDNG